MSNNEITIRETAQLEISGQLVAVGNIWERELPDSNEVIAPRMSATLSVHDPVSQEGWSEKVFAGSEISLGGDRYLVVNVEEGQSEPGSITLRSV